MSITRFKRLRRCGVFKDFEWPDGLEHFKRYNLIYGWNGTGTSTLGRILRSLELREPYTGGEVTIQCESTEIRGADFPQTTTPVRVFNREFVDEAVFPTSGVARRIFVLGRENVEDHRQLELLQSERTAAENNLHDLRTRRSAAESALEQFCEQQGRLIKTALRSASAHRYNNYNKATFKEDLDLLLLSGSSASLPLSEDARSAADSRMKATSRPSIPPLALPALDVGPIHDGVRVLLAQSVVAIAIESLRRDQPAEAWVRQGLALTQSRGHSICLFCEQPLPTNRLQDLERHFNDEYQSLLTKLDVEAANISTLRQSIERVRLPDVASIYDDLAVDFNNARLQVECAITGVLSKLGRLLRALESKRHSMFESVDLAAMDTAFSADSITALNTVIDRHNQRSQQFETQVNEARELLAIHMRAESTPEYLRFKNALAEAREAIAPAEAEVHRLTAEISRLEQAIVLHRLPAEQLNDDLKRYLGHGELQLAIQDTGYSITRNGQPALSLSEGERTAIALLYFLKSLEDRDFDVRRGVVVLDDPVSSLDQSALFAAFGFLRSRTQASGQLILMTHSFMFFRLAKEWFKHLRGPDKRSWRIFMLRCDVSNGERQSALSDIDPLLMSFESEYQYLFSRLYRMATDAPNSSLEAYFMAPSIARRVLESFLAFKVPDMGGDSNLWRRLQTIGFDETRTSRIYRFVQTHSHRDATADSDEDLTILSESRSVLNDLLALMRHGDETHVSRLISSLNADASDGGDST